MSCTSENENVANTTEIQISQDDVVYLLKSALEKSDPSQRPVLKELLEKFDRVRKTERNETSLPSPAVTVFLSDDDVKKLLQRSSSVPNTSYSRALKDFTAYKAQGQGRKLPVDSGAGSTAMTTASLSLGGEQSDWRSTVKQILCDPRLAEVFRDYALSDESYMVASGLIDYALTLVEDKVDIVQALSFQAMWMNVWSNFRKIITDHETVRREDFAARYGDPSDRLGDTAQREWRG